MKKVRRLLFLAALAAVFGGTANAGTPGVCKAPDIGTAAGVCWAPLSEPVTVALPAAERLGAGDRTILEAAWAAAAGTPQRVIGDTADDYAAKMDKKNCIAREFDFSPAIRAYGVYAPPGTETVRNRLVAELVRGLVCPQTS